LKYEYYNRTSVPNVLKGPCLFLKVQFQTYVVFSYLLYNNAV